MGKYSCEACKKKCKKEAIRLQDKYFHVACFICKECKKPLSTDGFFTKDGAHYCGADYQRLFGTKCFACGKGVEGQAMTVLGKTYHQDCFCCSKCLKKFQPGEKATFANKDEHWCRSCHEQHQHQLEQIAAATAATAEVVPKAVDHASVGTGLATTVEIPASPQVCTSEKGAHLSEEVDSPEMKAPQSNGFISPVSPGNLKTAAEVPVIPEVAPANNKKPPTKLPNVFGMPNNKFYNMSYLERSNADFKRGASMNPTAKDPNILHYHRPNNFSYTNLRKDFKSETGIHGYRDKDLVLLSKKPNGSVKPLAPIERDDWPGPPEPAAAYPDLLRDKVQTPKTPNEETNAENEKINKEIDELSKMTDSGAATVILRDLKKKRSESPTLDPRNSAMVPSASVEPPWKPRYEKPFFASPSRNLDMRQLVLQQERDRKSYNDALHSPGSPSNIIKPGHGLSLYRPGSSFDTHSGYQLDGHEFERRPQSSAGVLQSNAFDFYDDRRTGEIDPTTGLRHSFHVKTTTLPQGVSGHFFLDGFNLTSPSNKAAESPKIFTYEVLMEKNFDNLPGVNKDSLERHLSKEEFEQVFNMAQADFFRMPIWQRNEAKLKVGLV